MRRLRLLLYVLVGLSAAMPPAPGEEPAPLPRREGARPRNVILILTDDHRHDAIGFVGHPFLETPNLDRLGRNVHCRNALVATALCSPSRASILTGLYPHRHRVVDNNNPVPPGTIFFPQYLKQAGYDTAFIGKWHMGGESDAPQPGFDRWVSFRGQGTYPPSKNGLNVDGQRVPQKGYITDELTDYAIDWLAQRPADRPYFLYVSHKAVHSEFIPADRHKGRYANATFTPPTTMADTPENRRGKPMWAQNQRNSYHGAEFPYHGNLDIAAYYRRYCETLLAVDDSVGRLLKLLEERGQLESTLVLYMGDNGFAFGEHGLIDKRTAYEISMRVPMLVHCPELFKAGTVVDSMVANIDVAPTILEAAGLVPPESLDGRSFLGVAQDPTRKGRERFLYEYYWERNFPHTPTMHALRTNRFKFIRYYGLWDTDELYDIQADPHERTNLIRDPEHAATAAQLREELFATLERTGGMSIPLYSDRGGSMNLRRASGSKAAEFPDELLRP
jgi:N-acetylglucosamine-6-sulfatase